MAAGGLFESWDDDCLHSHVVVMCDHVAPYVSGEFYLRELPCILKMLDKINQKLECIIIDGYVSLGENEKPGLGIHLWNAISKMTPVIGVAKSPYAGVTNCSKIFRGESIRPLFITAVGISLDDAKECIRRMKGSHRMPTLLKNVDQLCRSVSFVNRSPDP